MEWLYLPDPEGMRVTIRHLATLLSILPLPYFGLFNPPTSAFIVYSTVAGGVSISTLFMAGYVPGILMGLGSMAVAFIYAKSINILPRKNPAKKP